MANLVAIVLLTASAGVVAFVVWAGVCAWKQDRK